MKNLILTTALLTLTAGAAAAQNSLVPPDTKQVFTRHSLAQSQAQNVDTPWATLGVVLGSSNNSPCGRTFFGVPSSGHNCTVRKEAAALYQALAPAYGKGKAAQAAVHHMCANDRTLRRTLVAVGVCTVK